MPGMGSNFKRRYAGAIGEGKKDLGFELTFKETGHLEHGIVKGSHSIERALRRSG